MEERRSLFRAEAVNNRVARRFGPPLRHQPLSMTVFCLIFLALFAALAGFTHHAEFKTTVNVRGYLAPVDGLIRVYPAWRGRYRDVRVQEGQSVRAGEVLAVVSRESHTREGEPRNEQQEKYFREEMARVEKEKQLVREDASHRLETLRETRRGLEDQLAVVERQLEVTRRHATLREQILDMHRPLLDGESISGRSYREQRIALLRVQRQVHDLERRLIARKSRLRDLALSMEAVPTERDRELLALEKSLARLRHEAAEAARDDVHSVVAPSGGVVTTVSADSGDVSHSGRPLLQILPGGAELEAILYLPAAAVGRVQEGQQVLITYDAFPFQTYGNHAGEVRAVSRHTLDPREQPLPVPGLREPVYRMRVGIQSQSVEGERSRDLRSGMMLSAEIVTAEMSLLEHLFQPLLKAWSK